MEKGIIKSKNKDYKSWIRTILIIFLAIQPILDVYMTLFDNYIQIANVSLATILRFSVVFVLLVVALFFERKRKVTWLFCGYSALVLVYIVIHHINSASFSIKLVSADYNFLNELLYIARMCIPIALIYIIYIIKLSYEDIKRIVVTASLIISVVIIVTNLCKVGFVAYSLKDRVIGDSMISWFTGSGIFWKELSCRGFFKAANPTSGVVILLSPVLAYICLNEKKIGYWVVLILQYIAMINLSTRIAVIGGVAVFAVIVAIYILEQIIHGKISLKKVGVKTTVCCVISSIIVAIFLLNSPFVMRSREDGLFSDLLSGVGDDIVYDDYEDTNTNSNIDNESSDVTSSDPDSDNESSNVSSSSDSENNDSDFTDVTPEEKKQYIEENYSQKGINNYYILKAYPYEQDLDFWYNLIKTVPSYEYAGNRNIRSFVLERVLERDGRISNYILGISFTRSSSLIWPERDFETHLDSLGIVGCLIFIGPYFMCLIVGVWFFFKRFKENLKVSKCVYLFGLVLGLATGYFSGHILNEVFPFVYLALMAGITVTNALTPEPEVEE